MIKCYEKQKQKISQIIPQIEKKFPGSIRRYIRSNDKEIEQLPRNQTFLRKNEKHISAVQSVASEPGVAATERAA